jgi:hypothetical protein
MPTRTTQSIGRQMSARITAQAKREAVIEAFDVGADSDAFDLDDPQAVNFLYARRHLAKVPERGHQELAYIVDLDDMDEAIGKMLDLIRERDGKKIFEEVAEYLIDSIETRRELARGKSRRVRRLRQVMEPSHGSGARRVSYRTIL